jgi:glycine cleavage system H protein
MIPDELRYTSDHEWVRELGDGLVRVGVTDHAQEQLGDVVTVQLPSVGDAVGAGDVLGEIESTKAFSEIYAPVGGEVVAVNDGLAEHPEWVNTDPYGEGWMVTIRVADESAAIDGLLDAAGYAALAEES